MPLYTRETLSALLARPDTGNTQIFLLFGERYLCKNASEQLEKALLEREGGIVHPIDGDQENIASTLIKLRSFSLLSGRQVYRVTDTRLFLSKQVAKTIWDKALKAQSNGKTEQVGRTLRAFIESGGLDPRSFDKDLDTMTPAEWQRCFGFAKPTGDLSWTRQYLTDQGNGATTSPVSPTEPAEMLGQALDAGIPKNNVLILLAEDVDKRKKLFKRLKDEQTVIDLSVDAGAGAKAQKEQKAVLLELVQNTLKEQDKTMAPGLADLLFERVGFHPVAVVMELQKVILFLGERRQITREDLDLLVGRTRQEALFELTAAITRRDREQALIIGDRLQENGIHPLAVVATLRNFVRGLLLFRALQEQPGLHFQTSMSAAAFQQNCLPRLKEHQQWKKELSGHPFALYMQFKSAANYSLPVLVDWMQLLLKAEFRLKGSPLAAPTVLQHLLLSLFAREAAKGEERAA